MGKLCMRRYFSATCVACCQHKFLPTVVPLQFCDELADVKGAKNEDADAQRICEIRLVSSGFGPPDPKHGRSQDDVTLGAEASM